MSTATGKYQDVKENKLVPLVMLYPHDRNYRSHPPEQIRKLKASLERFGQVRSIVVQALDNGTYTIVAGHGVFEAAQELKYEKLRADILPGWWSAEQVSGYVVADNQLNADAVDDEELLAELLQEQQNAGFDLASLGTDEESLRQMLRELGENIRDSLKVNQERTTERYEEVVDGSDRQHGTTPEEYLERYNATDVRQVVLIYDSQEFSRIMAILTQIRKREKTETNTEAVTLLLEQYVTDHALEDELCLGQK